MGGRGASAKGYKNYGSEFKTLYKYRNIKFVQSVSGNAKGPLETQAKGRIYGLINKKGELRSLTFYDLKGKRWKQIDLTHYHMVNGKLEKPHVHIGLLHNEGGDYRLSLREMKLIVRAVRAWYNRKSK